MTQYSQPWDGKTLGDALARAPYNASEWDDAWECWFGSDLNTGVIAGIDDELRTSGTASPLTVGSGAAFVKGKFFRCTDSISISVDTPVSATRYDWIVLRSCWDTSGDCASDTFPGSGEVCGPRKIRVCLYRGVEGAGVPPTLRHTDGILWEIPLYSLSITVGGVITLTNARIFIQNSPIFEEFFDAGRFMPEAGAIGPDPDPKYGWLFDPNTDQSARCSFEIPSMYRNRYFHAWIAWDGKAGTVFPSQVAWFCRFRFMQIGDITDPCVRVGLISCDPTITANDVLHFDHFEVLGPGAIDPVTDSEARDIVEIQLWRDANSSMGIDDYDGDARLIGVRIRIY